MVIANDRIEQFFSKQKRDTFDVLTQPHQSIIPTKEIVSILSEQKAYSLNSRIEERVKNLTHQFTQHSFLPVPAIAQTPLKQEKETNEPVQKKINKPLANHEQFVSESLAVREQSVSIPLAVREQTISHSLADPLAKIEEKVFTDLRDFSKKERDLLTFIFWQCHHHCSLFSPPMSTEEIRHTLKMSTERLRNLVFRITKKGGVKVVQHRSGQNAYRVFELPKSLYQWMRDQQMNRGIKLSEPLANPLANIPYSSNSSFLINKRITTSLPEEWKKINYEPLVEFGFSETQLQQLYETQITSPEIIQKSIDHFSYGLENNEKTKAYKMKDPLNVLMGVLRKGQSWNEVNYISKKELALKKIVEEKKKEKERCDLIIKELMAIEFPAWRNKLSHDQIKLIVPEEMLKVNLAPAITACLRAHYLKKILFPRLKLDEVIE